jgi:hypothetical protein
MKILVARYKGDISSIDDSILLKEILTIEIESRKRRAPSESGDPTSEDNNPAGRPVEPRAKASNKRLKSSK